MTLDPILNQWYEETESGRSFKVVAVDEDHDDIEIQYIDGDIGEFDFATWYETGFVPIDPPEDWSAPFDDVEPDDLGYSDPDVHEPGLRDITLDDLLNESEEDE
jgi:hypothetical protein